MLLKFVRKTFRFFFMHFFLELLSEFSDFVNSDDYVGKITSKSIGQYPVFIFFKYLNILKEGIISGEK